MDKTHQQSSDYIYIHIWLIAFSVMIFAFYVALDMKYLQAMLRIDSSYLAGVSILIFFGASLHAIVHIVATSRNIVIAQRVLTSRTTANGDAAYAAPPGSLVGAYLREMDAQSVLKGGKPGSEEIKTSVIEIYADKLRAPNEIGSFIIELLIRLGLLGTIIAFIIVFSSLADGPLPAASDIQKLLVNMASGMGTGLYTTLAGLVAATFLGVQYILLGRSVEHLISVLIRLGERKA